MPRDYYSVIDEVFSNTVKLWCKTTTDILLLVCYSHMAGAKSFEFFSDYKSIVGRIASLPPRTLIYVFRNHTVTVKGIVDETFIQHAVQQWENVSEFVVVGLQECDYGTTRWFPFLTGVTREELDEALHDMLGCEVAFGSNPEDDSSDSDVIIGVVPRDDGSIEIGAY